MRVRTRQTTVEQILHSGEDAIAKSDKQLIQLVKELFKGLSNDVYDSQTIAVIEETRQVLDIPAMALKLKDPSLTSLKLATLEFPKFQKAIENIPVRSLIDVPEEILAKQYKEFVKRVAKLAVFRRSQKGGSQRDGQAIL